MRQLVADHGSNAAVIYGVIEFGVEERRLQNACREIDVILRRRIVGIHRRRSHRPLLRVRRLADLVQVSPNCEFICAKRITERVNAVHFYTRVVAPILGIADFIGDGVQFLERALLGLRSHPVNFLDVFRHRRLESFDHLQHSLLAVSGERQFHIFLA